MSSFAAMWSPLLFGFALFLGSALLTVAQPMLGRTLVPQLGGNAEAWNACIVFFQATLLAGAVYVHLLHRMRGLRWQPWLHLLLMAVALLLCFVGVLGESLLLDLAPRLNSFEAWPILSTVCLLVVVIGLPYFALTAASSLVLRWFAHLDHPKASDPYFLLVASNLGGLMALVVYPLLIEPFAPMYAQWMSWNLAVTSLGALLFLTAFLAWRSPRNPELEPAAHSSDPDAPLIPRLIGRGPATWPRCLGWLFAAALPVSLLMGVTQHLTHEIAAAPVVWAVPLALYLLAFAQAFGRFSPLDYGGLPGKLIMRGMLGLVFIVSSMIAVAILANMNRQRAGDEGPMVFFVVVCFACLLLMPRSWLFVLQPLSALAVVFSQTSIHPAQSPVWGLALLACFYLSARLCLSWLAEDRPAVPALTTYFTWIGIGGLCGALAQLLIAPLLFGRGYLEYALFASLATMLRPTWVRNGLTDWIIVSILLKKKNAKPQDERSDSWGYIGTGFDIAFALVIAGFAACIFGLIRQQAWDETRLDLPLLAVLLIVAGLYMRPLRCGLALAAVVCLSFLGIEVDRNNALIFQQRTSFGIVRVTEGSQEIRRQGADLGGEPIPPRFTERRLSQASTHGTCVTEPPAMLRHPTAHYHRKGPVGQAMRNLEWFPTPAQELRQGNANFWLQLNRDNAKDDARIACSLVGMMTASLGSAPLPLDAITAAWSEPPFAFVGLGTGTLFTYAHPYQWVDAYEFDPAVITLSTQTPPLFHYFQSARARGVNANIIPGDARRSLSKPGREGFYHVLFVEADNSGALPLHLVTQEAVELYFQKLSPDGIVCFHTSNRNFDLADGLGNIARKLNLANEALTVFPDGANPDLTFVTAEWVVLARNENVLKQWTGPAGMANPRPNQRALTKAVWIDAHANPLSAIRPGVGWPGLIYGLLIILLFFGVLLGLIEIALAMMVRPAAKQTSNR